MSLSLPRVLRPTASCHPDHFSRSLYSIESIASASCSSLVTTTAFLDVLSCSTYRRTLPNSNRVIRRSLCPGPCVHGAPATSTSGLVLVPVPTVSSVRVDLHLEAAPFGYLHTVTIQPIPSVHCLISCESPAPGTEEEAIPETGDQPRARQAVRPGRVAVLARDDLLARACPGAGPGRGRRRRAPDRATST